MKIILLIYICIGSLFSNSLNTTLLNQINFNEQASDITGFNQDGREFAVVGLNTSISIMDITNPYEPFEITRIQGGSSDWRDVKYWNRHVYVGTEANEDNGLQIISVDNLDNPILVNTIEDFGSSHNIWIDSEGYLYVMGTILGCDIWIYSLTDPQNPQQVGCWDGEYIHDIDVKHNKIYASAINTSTIYILNAEDKSNVFTLTSWSYSGKAHDCSINDDGNILVTADEMPSGHLKIWDISDYNNIQLMSEYYTDIRHSIHNVYIKDSFVFCSYYADGLRVVDITYPTNPVEVAFYDTSDIEGVYVGNWGVYPFLDSGNIILSDIENGLFIVDLQGMAFLHEPLPNQDINVDTYTIISRVITFEDNLNDFRLYYRNYLGSNDDWLSIPLTLAIENLFFGQIPKQQIGSLIQYYLEATDFENNSYKIPQVDEQNPLFFTVGELPIYINEDFESYESSLNWSSESDDDATSGIWEWGIPIGTQMDNYVVQPYNDATINGINCFLTGNYSNDNVYFDDVDNGKTTLISPIYDFSEYPNLIMSFWMWYSNGFGENPNEDSFLLDVSNDSGSTWFNLKSYNKTTYDWIKKDIILSDYINLTDKMLLRFIASDLNDSSLVEVALDDLLFKPFGNPYDLGDANFDDSIDILDIVFILDYIQDNISFNLFESQASDFYIDGSINVLDIVALIEFILTE